MPLFLPPLARRDGGRAPLDLAGERERGAADFGERPFTEDPYIDVHAPRSRRLRPAHQAEIVERGADHAGDLADLTPPDSRYWIQIDAELIGMIEILGAHRVRVQLEAGQVGHP